MSDYFTSTGDVELWLMRDFDGQLPVFVVPGKTKDGLEAWKIDPCVSMTPDQREWLHTRLNDIKKTTRAGSWICHPTRAKTKLIKAPGITPSRYIHWGGLTAKDQVVHLTNGSPLDNLIEADMGSSAAAFVRYAANMMGTDDLAGANRMWMQFCRAAVNWLTVEQKPLDLFFCRMMAFPYRTNWQQIMAAKFPGFLELAQLPREERMKQLEMTNLKVHLQLPEMAALHRSGTFEWAVSVELRDYFFNHARKNEEHEFNRVGPARYYERWVRLCRSAYAGVVDSLAAYCVQASWPVGDVDLSLPAHSRFLRRLLSLGRVRPAAPDVPPTDYILGDGPADSAVKRKGRPPEAKTFDVQEIPDGNITIDD